MILLENKFVLDLYISEYINYAYITSNRVNIANLNFALNYFINTNLFKN